MKLALRLFLPFPRLLLGLLSGLLSCESVRKPTRPATVQAVHRPVHQPPAPRSLVPRYHSAPPGSFTSNLIATARSYLDSPYSTGGTTSVGLDCSGFVSICFRQVGITVPRVARQQAETGQPVPLDEVQPGDLVFFSTNRKAGSEAPTPAQINHTGIVTEVRPTGEVLFIHSSSSRGVREDNLLSSYWRTAFAWLRRVKDEK